MNIVVIIAYKNQWLCRNNECFNYYFKIKSLYLSRLMRCLFFLVLKHAPPRYLISNFFKFGRLKEFRLIDSTVKPIDKFINMNLGREERVIKLNNAENSEPIKNVLVELFDNFSPESRICFLNHGEFDEISFIITHNGISKTFYVKDKEKIRASLNVSKMVEFKDGEATFDSLIKICLELIDSAA